MLSDDCNIGNDLRRRLYRAFLDIFLLRLIDEEPRWGYRLMEILRDRYGLRVGPPVLYPLLSSLERRGMVEGFDVHVGGRRRKVYQLTSRGRAYMRRFREVVREALDL